MVFTQQYAAGRSMLLIFVLFLTGCPRSVRPQEGGRDEPPACCFGALAGVPETPLNISSVVIETRDIDTSFQRCSEHNEAITSLRIDRARVSACRLNAVPSRPDDPWQFRFEELTLQIGLTPCGGGPPPPRQTVSVTFHRLVYGGRLGSFNDQLCVVNAALGTDVVGRPLDFETSDGGFSRLFTSPAGATLLTQIVSAYALPIMVANQAVPPGGGPATCLTAMFVGPTGVAEPPFRHHPAVCP